MEVTKVTDRFYSNGAARTSVNTPVSLAKQRAITRSLKRQNSVKITNVVRSTPSFNTENVLPSFIAIAHTDLENDIRNMPGFIDCKDYGTLTPYEAEIGAVEDCRYLLSSIFTSIPGSATAGGAYAGSGVNMVTADNTHADVYPILYISRDAYGIVALKGKYAVTPIVINPTPTKSDPLGQRGSMGWKTMQTAVILNDAWMSRLECAVTDL